MAQNSITIQLTIDDKGTLRQVSKEADEARKGYDGVAKSSAQADRNIKGAARASSNGTKNFSKMQQGIMRGLVPAYATLAANLFAVSAAFSFLRQASDFQRLLEGQEALTMATGIAYESLATSIQKATDSQITFTEASRSAAIGISAGLSADQLIGLSEAANTVSRVLGRDLVDSYNRLIRGVTKAEPELLDELGIILRLDDANKRYADSLGLVASELTPYQRSQAVTNEVLRQVEERYGKVNEILDPTGAALNKLAVSFENLTKKLGTALVGPANFIADVLNENIIAATSVLGLFGASILNSVIPSLSDLSKESEALEKGIESLSAGIGDIEKEIKKTPKSMRTFGDSMELADLKARKLAKESKLLGLQINQVGVAALKAARGFLRFAGIVGAVVSAGAVLFELVDVLKEKLGLVNEEAEKLRENLKELSGGLDTATKDFERMAYRIEKTGIDFLADRITILGNAASSISTDELRETVELIRAGISEQEKFKHAGGFLGSGIPTGEFERVVSAESAEAAESLEKYLTAVGRVIPEVGRIAKGITDFTAVSDESLQSISRAIELHKGRLQVQKRVSELAEEETQSVRQLASAYSATPIDRHLRILTESVDMRRQDLDNLIQTANVDGIITEQEAEQLSIAEKRLEKTKERAAVFGNLRNEEIANLDKINELSIAQVRLQGKVTLAARRQAALLSEKQAEVALEAKLLEIRTIRASVTESSTPDEQRTAKLAIQNLEREIALDEAKLDLLRQQNDELLQLRNNATQAFEGALQTSLKDIITGQTSSLKEAVVKIAQATLESIATSLSQMMATRVSEALFGSKAQDMKNALTEGAQRIEDAIVRGAQKAAGIFSGDTTQETTQTAVSREGTQMSMFQRAKTYLFGRGARSRVEAVRSGETQPSGGSVVLSDELQGGIFSRFVEGLKGLFSKDAPFLQSLGNIFAGGLQGFGTLFSDILGGLFGGGGGGGLFGTLAKGALSLIPGVGGIAAMLPFKEGGISTPSGKVPGYAVGGIAKGPTQGYPAILHGTEAVVPLPNGKSIPVEPRGSMATNNVEIHVNVDNQGNAQTQTQMDDQQAGNLGRAISAAVQEELQRQKRPGGILSPFGAA